MSSFSPRYSPVSNSEIEPSTFTSWQSIGDYLAPRPTSSVLSNSDTEDDANYYSRRVSPAASSRDSAVHVPYPNTASCFVDGDIEDDEKTIEIDMNQGRTSRVLTSTGSVSASPSASACSSDSSFLMPDTSVNKLYESLEYERGSGTKILIIGHRKSNFFKMLDQPLSYRFTLNVKESYNIILIIFDGLIKIGNILNFIKQNGEVIKGKLIIPIFKNINQHVVNRITKAHGLNLLCPPINYDNKSQVDNLLELLNQDFLLKESFYSTRAALTCYDRPMVSASEEDDMPQHEYQLVSLKGDTNSQILSESIPPKSSVFIHHNTLEKSSYSLQNNQLALKSNDGTRKQRYRKKKKKSTFVFLSVTLSLGIGIGITTAFAITHLISPSDPPSKAAIDPLLAMTSLSRTSTVLDRSVEVMKGNLINFKQFVGGVSRLMWFEVETLAHKWDGWIIHAGNDFSHTFLWLL
jgi:hypothetical protein